MKKEGESQYRQQLTLTTFHIKNQVRIKTNRQLNYEGSLRFRMLTIESQDCFHLDISFVLLSLRLSSLSWRPGFPRAWTGSAFSRKHQDPFSWSEWASYQLFRAQALSRQTSFWKLITLLHWMIPPLTIRKIHMKTNKLLPRLTFKKEKE